jgi:class 3 adenylate cyclase
MDAERPPRAVYRFGRFTLDLSRGALLAADGAELPLRPKSFALLRLLVENAGRLLDRDAIMAAVWPDVFVTDDSITQCVREIRRALGDDPPRLLRTVQRRGYLFAAEVSRAGPAAAVPEELPALIKETSSQRPPAPMLIQPRDSPGVKRHLAAILATDMVGYSRLMGRDEVGTLARLKVLRAQVLEPLIAEHHGRVVKLMGDGLLAEFASVVDAVACAVAWQESVAKREAENDEDARFRFRIGINLGDVMEDGDLYGDGVNVLYGDGVNVAARLEQLAAPGEVLVSGTLQLPTSLTSRRGRYSCDFDLCLSPIRSLEAEGLQTAQHRGTRS